MTRVYLDNAATTPIHPEVVEVMTNAMLQNFGNPSSTHQNGRTAKVIVETARKSIAKHFNVSSSEIVFTSGGTEANNFVFFNAVQNLDVKRIITTRIEHSAVLNPIKFFEENNNVEVVYLSLDEFGNIDLKELESLLLDKAKKTLVSLMMVNNEIGNLLPIYKVGVLCKANGVLFHSDTVQAIGHYKLDLQDIPVDFIVGSAHKFHGPKGVGFLYVKKGVSVKSFFYGGKQEKGARPGTENVHSILGMQKALDLVFSDFSKKEEYLISLKRYLIDELQANFKDISFNGMSSDFDNSSSAIVNVQFPTTDKMLLFYLDLDGVSASYGSACQSGASKASYVLENLYDIKKESRISIRFSFSLFTEKKELDFLLKKLKNRF